MNQIKEPSAGGPWGPSRARVLVVIPTVGNPDVLVPSFRRLIRTIEQSDLTVRIAMCVNPLDPDAADRAVAECVALHEASGCASLLVYRHPGPCGFGGAINRALSAAAGFPDPAGVVVSNDFGSDGLADLLVVYNDDLAPSDGWLDGMWNALWSETVSEWSEAPGMDGRRPERRMADYLGDRQVPGLVGPVSNVTAGIQLIGPTDQEEFAKTGPDRFSASWRARHAGERFTATFLSGFCLGITLDCANDIALAGPDGNPLLFDERYKIAGYEDNDLCARADRAGWRAVVAADTFVAHIGHQTFDANFPEMQRGLRNRGTYYDAWRLNRVERLAAVFRVRFDVPHDLDLMRMALARAGQLVDDIVILLTGPITAVRDSSEWTSDVAHDVRTLLAKVVGATPSRQADALETWARTWAHHTPDSRKPTVHAFGWDGAFNERDERNAAIERAVERGATWIFSLDHDEAVEPRVTRAHLDRLMRHPDPLVQEWDFAWVNHWNTNRLVNVSQPWGDGGRFTGGMHGYRLFRVCGVNPRRIQAGTDNGLHCGNIPQVDPLAKRIAGIRIRHFGYMRYEDRHRKFGRYAQQDPNPNPMLVGGDSYAHITDEENQIMTVFVAEDGIGLHMLLHEGESPDDVGRVLDELYGLVDRIVLVWTGEWSDGDRGWCSAPHAAVPGQRRTVRATDAAWDDTATWPETGPSRAMARMAGHFGAEWVHEPLWTDDPSLSRCRNAALDALQGTPGLGWAFFVDPDEQLGQHVSGVALRRMADATNAWGWLVTFRNAHGDGSGNLSESVRMSRLDPGGRMRMDGRVHEGFARAVRSLRDDGYGQILRLSPMTLLNTGLALGPEEMRAKLERYRKLTEADLREDPINPGAWTTLGLYWANEGAVSTALECFGRGMASAQEEFLPFHEAGIAHLRLARMFMSEALSRIGRGHPRHDIVEQIIGFLDSAAPPLHHLGTQLPAPDESAIELPPFPSQG